MMARSYMLLLLLTITPSLPADYQSGLDAYNSGDYETAMQQWQEAAATPRTTLNSAVYAETYYAIAMLYWQGQGVPRDYHQARDWLVKAADLNHAGAQAKLGYLYTDGIAAPQDLDRAFEWFSQAARQGDVDGQYNLGIFYLNGWGIEQDTTMAKQYLAAASAQGDQAAEQALQQLSRVGAGQARDPEQN
jgi:TPR repeat protein